MINEGYTRDEVRRCISACLTPLNPAARKPRAELPKMVSPEFAKKVRKTYEAITTLRLANLSNPCLGPANRRIEDKLIEEIWLAFEAES